MNEPNAIRPLAPSDGGAALPKPVSLREVLQEAPLYSPREVKDLFEQEESGGLDFPKVIHIHCENDLCDGVRRHHLGGEEICQFGTVGIYYSFVRYYRSNCDLFTKLFGLKAEIKGKPLAGICTKIYQEPPFGNPIPKRLFEVIGEFNREYFLQARRAIARGLGIGAYAYYRRIVENTKFDLVSSVLEIARVTKASSAQIELLQKARSEKQFSKAMDMLREVSAIPAVLLIDGHNPLALLHDLLSEGIHQLEDLECLERAKEAEIILCEIADRMQIALTERKAVKAAITSIVNRKK